MTEEEIQAIVAPVIENATRAAQAAMNNDTSTPTDVSDPLDELVAEVQRGLGAAEPLPADVLANLRSRFAVRRRGRRLRMFVDGQERAPGKLMSTPQVGDVLRDIFLGTETGEIVAIENTDTECILRVESIPLGSTRSRTV